MMKSTVIAGALAFLALSPAASAEQKFDPQPFLQQAITRVKKEAYRSDQVDWPQLEAKVFAAGKDAKDPIDLLGGLWVLVEGLGDGHSFIQTSPAYKETFKSRYGRNYWETGQPPRKPILSQFMARSEPSARPLSLPAAKAELVVVPKMHGGGDRPVSTPKSSSASSRTPPIGPADISSIFAAIRAGTSGPW